MSHLVEGTHCEVHSLDRPFSAFDFVEDRFSGSPPIRNLFSMSRAREGKTLVLEVVPATDGVAEENEDLAVQDSEFRSLAVIRVSFWDCVFEGDDPVPDGGCLGYAILKNDCLAKQGRIGWFIYEAVFGINQHAHNYINAAAEFEFSCRGAKVSVRGCLYAQQNTVNKTCAQVAIRSIASTYLGRNDISYRQINELAKVHNPAFVASDGMSNDEIVYVLSELGLNVIPTDYGLFESEFPQIREAYPYPKPVYSGIEGGCGALVSFRLDGPDAPAVGHVIPFFGHTFNGDAWAPVAGPAYFRIGESVRYLPSRAWTSNFLIHDDNFGANLCIPQNFLDRAHVQCVFELLPQGWTYSGTLAEGAAAGYFYSLLPNLVPSNELPWLRRLREYVGQQRLILRHIPITKKDYLAQLRKGKDWDGNQEERESLDDLELSVTGEIFWMVEVSVPEIFNTNKRKLGEILLDASQEISDETDGTSFVLARFPGLFLFFDQMSDEGDPVFTSTPSGLKSHMALFSNCPVETKIPLPGN